MSENNNADLLKDMFEALSSGDIEKFLSCLSEDVEWITPGLPEIVPHAGIRKGKEQVAQWLKALREVEEILDFKANEFLSKGDKVVVLGRSKVRIKVSNIIQDIDWVQVYTVRDGKVEHYQEFYDSAKEVKAFKKKK